jgi:alkanesulfonate monooxygenase SsuD/methylene tetrahydromethanopterin reductase-like flavin-dependent oxidoreductase (luciferase family)
MWRGDTQPFLGKHYQLAEPLNFPAPISPPRPPILIGGGGERKTLRLVARYADACNLFARLPVYDLARKLETLREYCIAEGRAFESIEKTALADWDVARRSPDRMINQVRELRELEFDTLIVSLKGIETVKPIEVLARDVIPHASQL